jgi:hypothetical protein
MARRILILNLALLTGVALASYELVTAWRDFEESRNLERILRESEGRLGEAEIHPPGVPAEESLLHDFFVIGERDLFSPDRRPEPIEQEAVVVEQAPSFPKRPQLRGLTEANGEMRAALTVFNDPRAEGESRIVGVGEFVQGYVVSQISDTAVTLRWNDVQEVIGFFDSDDGAPRGAPAARRGAAVNIIRIGSQVAAVETTTPESAEGAGEQPGLQVSAVGGGQAATRAGGAGGLRGSLMDRRPGASPARGGQPRQVSPLSGASGLVTPRGAPPPDQPNQR